jgi:hypothetical protein
MKIGSKMDTATELHVHDISPSQMDNTPKTDHNFLIQKCSYCNEEMELVAGSVIFGDKWYHSSCWKSLESLRMSGEVYPKSRGLDVEPIFQIL